MAEECSNQVLATGEDGKGVAVLRGSGLRWEVPKRAESLLVLCGHRDRDSCGDILGVGFVDDPRVGVHEARGRATVHS